MVATVAALIAAVTGSHAALAAMCGQGLPGGLGGPSSVTGVPTYVADTPPGMTAMELFGQAAAASSLGPDGEFYLAAINEVETDFGRSSLPGVHSGANSAGAEGPMQFLAGTWAQYGDGHANDVYNEYDAVYGAARYLRASGAPVTWPEAIFQYNHAGWYVDEVTKLAMQYESSASAGQGAGAIAGAGATSTTQGLWQLSTDKGGIAAGIVYGSARSDRGLGGYDHESLASDFANGQPPYGELGGTTAKTARLLGGLPPQTPLEIINPATGQSIVAYKRDFGAVAGKPSLGGHRVRIELWWQTAAAIGLHGPGLVELQPALAPTTPTSTNCDALQGGTPLGAAGGPATMGNANGPLGDRIVYYASKWLSSCLQANGQPYPRPNDIQYAGPGCPYQWGGGDENGPTTGTTVGSSFGTDRVGFDCSGLVKYAVYQATHGRLDLPHLASAQYAELPHVQQGQLRPGDVVFFDNLGHVGIYIGGGKIINAPETWVGPGVAGVVSIGSITSGWLHDTYVGAGRVSG
jgi:hypothetical protein